MTQTYYSANQLFGYRNQHPIIFPVDLSLYKLKELLEAHTECHAHYKKVIKETIGKDLFTTYLEENKKQELLDLSNCLRQKGGVRVDYEYTPSFVFSKEHLLKKEVMELRERVAKLTSKHKELKHFDYQGCSHPPKRNIPLFEGEEKKEESVNV
tara:strand:- start:224 stop:685 length:462 start_codon:yes stop_codon:yes gene_type:complete